MSATIRNGRAELYVSVNKQAGNYVDAQGEDHRIKGKREEAME